MDDLAAKISEILGSEEGMKQVGEMAEMLGLDSSQITKSLGRETADEAPPENSRQSQDMFDGINMETLIKVQKLMKEMNCQNSDAALLDALKPYVSPKRSQKIDEAKKIMGLIKLIPLINREKE